jgi:ribonuclease G
VVEHAAVQEIARVERTLERGLDQQRLLGQGSTCAAGNTVRVYRHRLGPRHIFLHVADLMSSINSRHAESEAVPGCRHRCGVW